MFFAKAILSKHTEFAAAVVSLQAFGIRLIDTAATDPRDNHNGNNNKPNNNNHNNSIIAKELGK